MTLKNIRSIKNKLSDSLSKIHQIPDGHIASLDAARFIAAFFIIIGHVAPFYVSVNYTGNELVGAFAYVFVHIRRMGIVFFLLSSGFLFSRSLHKGRPLIPQYRKTIKSLAMIFFVSSVFYALIPSSNEHLMKNIVTYGILKSYYWHLLETAQQPLLLLIRGTKYHLWFIPSLMVSISILTAFIFCKKERYLLWLAIALYLLTIFLFQVPQSVVKTYVFYRYIRAYCSGFVLVTFGWWFSLQKDFSLKDAVKLFLMAFFFQVLQDISLWHLYGLKPDRFMSIGLLPAILGVFVAVMCCPDFGKNSTFERWGRMTLGIYILHPFILDLLQLLNKKIMLNTTVRDLTFPVVIAVACAFSVKLFSKNPLLREIIS